MRKNSWYYDHEKKLIEHFDTEIKPHIHDAIQELHKSIGLDYYGIDCALDEEMNLLIFEINPNMNILFNDAQLPNIWSPQIDLIKAQIKTMMLNRCTQTQQAR